MDRITVSQKELLKDTAEIIIPDYAGVKLNHFNERSLVL
jgi:hypothetical protein